MADAIPIWRLVQETREFIPIEVAANDVVTTAFEVSVCAGVARPTVWLPADVVLGESGVLVGVGTSWPLVLRVKYTVFVRFADNPEEPVVRATYVKVT